MRKKFQPIIDYVEGRMSVTEFQHLFKTDRTLQKTLKLPLNKSYSCYKEYKYNLFNFFNGYWRYKDKDWNTIVCRSGIQWELMRFLDEYGLTYEYYKKYDDDDDFLRAIQPSWLDIYDDSILQPIIDSIPKDLSKTKRIAMGKEKIKALFKYDRTFPRWVQAPEWPIVNGKPLVFSHQKKAKGDDIRTYYYFYDEDTKEETVIVQFD